MNSEGMVTDENPLIIKGLGGGHIDGERNMLPATPYSSRLDLSLELDLLSESNSSELSLLSSGVESVSGHEGRRRRRRRGRYGECGNSSPESNSSGSSSSSLDGEEIFTETGSKSFFSCASLIGGRRRSRALSQGRGDSNRVRGGSRSRRVERMRRGRGRGIIGNGVDQPQDGPKFCLFGKRVVRSRGIGRGGRS